MIPGQQRTTALRFVLRPGKMSGGDTSNLTRLSQAERRLCCAGPTAFKLKAKMESHVDTAPEL
jgi:hypothetical protein